MALEFIDSIVVKSIRYGANQKTVTMLTAASLFTSSAGRIEHPFRI